MAGPLNPAAMRLGIHASWRPGLVTPRPAATLPIPDVWGRDVDTPRVAGHNDMVGDCVPTMCCNAVQTLLGRRGVRTPIPDGLAVDVYAAVTGYSPADPASDQGTDPDAMFAWWKANAISGYRLREAIAITPQDEQAMMRAVSQDGGAGLIVNLAVEQQNEVIWTPAGTPGSWGRHALFADQRVGATGATSWGLEKWIAPAFMAAAERVVAAYVFDLVPA
jgi:hypothetical protein